MIKTIRRALMRLATIFRGHARGDEDLRAEMDAHLEMETAENVRRGMPPSEARRRAMVASGGVTQAAEAVRKERGLPWLEDVVADARYAFRHFVRTPLSTVTMILVLSLGIGVNVVLFTVMNSLATLPAPGIPRDDELVRIRGHMRAKNASAIEARLLSWPEVQQYAAQTQLFSSVAAHANETAVVTTSDASSAAINANVIYATSNYFNTLDVRAALGTEPIAERNVTQLTTSPTAMISDALWKQKFGGARDVIGRIVRVNDVPVQIVGVAPPRFIGTGGGGALTIWISLAAYPLIQKRTAATFASADSAFLTAFARLTPDIGPETATPAVTGIARRLSRDGGRETLTADVVPMLASNSRIGDRMDLLISRATAGGFALLALLITCTNVSALLVGLAVARRREIGVRLSLGAPRARLIRQLLTESVLLALLAATVGLLVTTLGIRLVGTALGDMQLVVDWRVTIATCAIAVITGILFGLSPALHATRISVGEVLKGSASSVAATRSRLQRALVVAQVTLTQPLLVGLGVVIATMMSDAGRGATSRAPDKIAEIELDTWSGRVSNEERAARIAAIVERVGAMPGVVAAMPLQMGTVSASLTVFPADRIAGVSYDAAMRTRFVAAPKGFFSTFDIPILRGRDFNNDEFARGSNADPARAPSYDAVIVGSDLARRLWGNDNPLGRRLALVGSRSAAMVVVGVVDEAAAGPGEVNGELRVYVPYSAINDGVVARTAGPALPMLDAMRKVAQAEAPQMPILRAQTLEQREAEFRRNLVRTSGAVAGGGLLALLLSAIGLYAVVSFAVGQRTREIGIRTALGAPRGEVVRIFFRSGLALSALGLVLGLPLSMIVTRLISTTLNWPLASSPLLGAGIGAIVLAVASLAVWIPARRATRIDPIVALRAD